jgi:general secretion pathway protein G
MLALQRPAHSGGFSFIELLVSAAIIGLLASVAVPVVQTSVKRQKERELRIALRDIRQGIDAYKQAGVAGRIAVPQDQSGYPPSLQVLVDGVDDVSRPEHPKLYFMRRIPRDPFFPDSSVKAIDTWGRRSFASPPEKPEAGDEVFDVYTKSSLTGLNGVPYREW